MASAETLPKNIILELVKDNQQVSKISDLFNARGPLLWINLITLYRTAAFPFLVYLIFTHQFDIFKWLLIISFLTDAIDGFLERGYKINSILGSRLDSIGDDLTVLAALLGLIIAHPDFLLDYWVVFAIPLGLFFIQTVMALLRYGKVSSFHTYLAKMAAVLQGFFLCSMFLFPQPVWWLFYSAAVITSVELVEEIIIVLVLKEWKTNVHGLYWVLKNESSADNTQKV